MQVLSLEKIAGRLRREIAQGARKDAFSEILTGLHPSEVGKILQDLEPELSIIVLRSMDRSLAAVVLSEISVENLLYFLETAPLEDIVRILAALPNEDDSKIAPHLAETLFDLDKSIQAPVFLALPRQVAADVFSLLEPDQRDELLLTLTDQQVRRVLTDLSPDDRTELFENLPGQVTQRLLNLLSPSDLAETKRLLGYPEESVGRLMTPDYIAIRPQWSVDRALDHIRQKAKRSETVDTIYVTDAHWKLVDALDLKKLVLAPSEATIESLMDDTFVCLSSYDDREVAVEFMKRYDTSVLPVVDSDGTLVGVVTFDDIMDVAEEEATEDFHKVAGISPLKRSFGQTDYFELIKRRLGWLLILVFMNIFSGAVIASFEEILAATIALVFFLPLLIDSGGNAGSQAATLIVRAMAVGEVRPQDWLRVAGRDLSVGLSMGLVMAAAVFILGYFRSGPSVGMVVACSMVLIVVFGSILGTLLPFVLSKLKLDPAAASAPLVTSLADIGGVLIYLSIATVLLKH